MYHVFYFSCSLQWCKKLVAFIKIVAVVSEIVFSIGIALRFPRCEIWLTAS